MRRLVYLSFAHSHWPLIDLLGLLEGARRNNQRCGISGMLLYSDRVFMQLIEGPEAAIAMLLATLATDPRHTRLTVLSDQRVAAHRLFPDWGMAFHHLSAIEPVVSEGLLSNDTDPAGPFSEACRQDPSGAIMAEFFRTHQQALIRSRSPLAVA